MNEIRKLRENLDREAREEWREFKNKKVSVSSILIEQIARFRYLLQIRLGSIGNSVEVFYEPKDNLVHVECEYYAKDDFSGPDRTRVIRLKPESEDFLHNATIVDSAVYDSETAEGSRTLELHRNKVVDKTRDNFIFGCVQEALDAWWVFSA